MLFLSFQTGSFFCLSVCLVILHGRPDRHYVPGEWNSVRRSSVMKRGCGGQEVFYSLMIRSQSFGEPVPPTENFTSASQLPQPPLRWDRVAGVGYLSSPKLVRFSQNLVDWTLVNQLVLRTALTNRMLWLFQNGHFFLLPPGSTGDFLFWDSLTEPRRAPRWEFT